MERIFVRYLWQFVLVYIDDTIIFSNDIETHIRDLSTVLSLLCKSGITLKLRRCHFTQPGLHALSHYIYRLSLSTVEEEVEAIRAI
jgi:hypothetical protein